MIELQNIPFPSDCVVVNNDFYTYDPVNDFKEGHSITYLTEDLLQCKFPAHDMIIDLGWYGDPLTNQGEFKIQVIQHENWQIPFNVIHSKSVAEIKELLIKVLEYFGKPEVEQESDTEDQFSESGY